MIFCRWHRWGPQCATLKLMDLWRDSTRLSNLCWEKLSDRRNWDHVLPYLLEVREIPQYSMGFSQFYLLYSHKPRGLLDLAKEAWDSNPVLTGPWLNMWQRCKTRWLWCIPLWRSTWESPEEQNYPTQTVQSQRPSLGAGTHSRM